MSTDAVPPHAARALPTGPVAVLPADTREYGEESYRRTGPGRRRPANASGAASSPNGAGPARPR